jgi:hypothetical protein
MFNSKKQLPCRWILISFFWGLFFILACPFVSSAQTQWNVGISGGKQGIDSFNISIGEYYKVPQDEVVVIHKRGIPEDEMPVVFFLAQRAHVRPEVIVSMRMRNMSWMDITLHYGLSPEIYYVPVRVKHYGPPYGHAYGYYKKYPHKDWYKIRLSDADIINQVNLKFISEHHGYAPEEVMRYRSAGRDYTAIDYDIRQEKYHKEKHHKNKDKEWKEEKYQGKGKGKDKGKDQE